MAKLTVSIVNFNAGEYLLNCLNSLKKVEDEVSMDIYVVDNNSSDSSILEAKEKYPEIKLILNSENRGFGAAHNQILNVNKNEYILILNPDVEVQRGDLKTLLNFMEGNKDVGALTPEIILPSGKRDLTAHRGFPTPLAAFKYYILNDDSLYHLTGMDMSKPHEVDAITGAFLLTRKTVLASVGLFDEDYFMYAEDIDLCYRIKKAGFKIMYLPDVKVLHHKGVSTGLKKHSQQVSSATLETRQKMVGYFYSTMKIFYQKNLAKNYPFFINWLVYLGIYLKWFMSKRKLTV